MLHNPVFISAEPRLDKAAHQTTPIDQFLKLRVEAGQAPTPASRQETGSLPGVSGQQLGFPWRLPETD